MFIKYTRNKPMWFCFMLLLLFFFFSRINLVTAVPNTIILLSSRFQSQPMKSHMIMTRLYTHTISLLHDPSFSWSSNHMILPSPVQTTTAQTSNIHPTSSHISAALFVMWKNNVLLLSSSLLKNLPLLSWPAAWSVDRLGEGSIGYETTAFWLSKKSS